MYAHFDAFCLLLDSAHGTRFQNFVDELAQVEVEYTYKFLETVGWTDVNELPSAKELMHIVSTGYFEGIFEVIRHRMDREVCGAAGALPRGGLRCSVFPGKIRLTRLRTRRAKGSSLSIKS